MILKVGLGISLLLNMYALFLIFNAAISLDGCRSEQAHLRDQSKVCLKMLNAVFVGSEASQVIAKLNEDAVQPLLVKRDGDELLIDSLVFQLEGERVRAVRSLSD